MMRQIETDKASFWCVGGFRGSRGRCLSRTRVVGRDKSFERQDESPSGREAVRVACPRGPKLVAESGVCGNGDSI